MLYEWGSLSSNDPTQLPLKFLTQEQADKHTLSMNKLIDTWEENLTGLWNKNHWKVKPQEWVTIKL